MKSKNKFKIVRRGTRWCVRVKPDRDEFDRETWPAHAVKEWLNDYGIPHSAKSRETVTIRDTWWTYNIPATWTRDYIFESKEDVTWFMMQWAQ